MSIKHYTPEFKDEAMRQSDQSRSYSYPEDCLRRGHYKIHQVSQDRIARLTPTAYQSAVVFLAADTSGHDLVIDGAGLHPLLHFALVEILVGLRGR